MNSSRMLKPSVIVSVLFLVVLFIGPLTLWLVGVKARAQRGEAEAVKERKAAQAEKLPLTANDLRRNPPVAEADNAAPIYNQIFAGFKAKATQYTPLEKEALKLISLESTAEEKASGLKAAHTLVTLAQPELALMKLAAQKPDCDFHYEWEKGAGVMFPQFAEMRKMARLLAINAEVLDKAGKPMEALEQIEIGSKLVDHLRESPILIGMLVRIAIEVILDREWHTLVNRHGEDIAVLERAAKVNAMFGKMPSLQTALRGEVWMGMWCINAVRTGEWTEKNIFGEEGESGESEMPRLSPAMAGVYEKNLLAFWRKAFRELDETKGDSMQSAQVMIKAAEAEEIAAKADPAGHLLNAVIMPAFSPAALKLVQIDVLRQMRILKLELLKARLKNGTFPKDLQGFDTKLTHDPFSGQSLIYRVEGKGFILYSIGRNGQDDGGQRTTDDKNIVDIVTTYP